MLDFAQLCAQMEASLDEGRWKPEGLAGALQSARDLCARCHDTPHIFNESVRLAIQNETVPNGCHPAELLEENVAPDAWHFAPPIETPRVVVATDGSQIYPDAHQIADCYLVQTSGIILRYGTQDEIGDNASLRAEAKFFSGVETDIEVQNDEAKAVYIGANRELVDARRHLNELEELAKLLETIPEEYATLGLGDGIFDLRVSSLQPWRDWAHDSNENRLDRLRRCGQPIAGYISASRAADVVSALRLLPDSENAENLAALPDVRLFDAILPVGARSNIFKSNRLSAGKTPKASRHQTCFFYLKTAETQVARLEFPIWVAQRAGWPDLIHALIAEQVEKGAGFPVALMEAHEHAVVRAADRDLFYQLLEEILLRRGYSAQRSTKNASKMRPLV